MSRPIGIFDSGLGGLTVLKVLAKAFPHESFCYLGDIARLPYGNKSPETIRRYGLQILNYLKLQDVKTIIIACNSASTVFLGEKDFEGIPLLNVIEPGAAAALEISEDNKIAVLGTPATIRSHAYRDTLQRMAPGVQVIEQACPLLVPIVEEGLVNDPVTELISRRYLSEIMAQNFSTVILGCTHYPVIKDDLRKVLGEKVNLVESGDVLARELKGLITDRVIENSTGTQSIRVCITDLTDHFERLAHHLMAPIAIGELEQIVL